MSPRPVSAIGLSAPRDRNTQQECHQQRPERRLAGDVAQNAQWQARLSARVDGAADPVGCASHGLRHFRDGRFGLRCGIEAFVDKGWGLVAHHPVLAHVAMRHPIDWQVAVLKGCRYSDPMFRVPIGSTGQCRSDTTRARRKQAWPDIPDFQVCFERAAAAASCLGPMPWSAASWAAFPLSDREREAGRLRRRWCPTMPKPFVTSMARLVRAIVPARPEVYAFPHVPARLKAHAFPRRDDRVRTTR